MSEPPAERRRERRVTVPAGVAHAEWPLAITVRVVDIAAGGVLLASPVPLDPGQEARLKMRLGDRPVEADIEVNRSVMPGGGKRGYDIGARFVAAGESLRRTLKQFLASGER